MDVNIFARSIKKNSTLHECVSIKYYNNNFIMDGTYTFGSFNDLTRAKIGIPFSGIINLYDNQLRNIFYNVYSDLIFNDEIQSYNLLYLFHKDINKIDFVENINKFLILLKNNNVNNNELLCVFNYLSNKGYFDAFEYAFISCNFNDSLERNILLCHNDEFYLLRTNSYEFYKLCDDLVKELFLNETIKYENDDYKIKKLVI